MWYVPAVRSTPSDRTDLSDLSHKRYRVVAGLSVMLLLLGASPTLAAFTIFQAGFADRPSCWVDYDSDGWVDLHDGDKLWRNNNGASFTIVVGVGSGGSGNSQWGDFNNDGHPDVYSGIGVLTRNDGGTAGFAHTVMPFPALNLVLSQASCWADHNNDGYIDLYIGGYEGAGYEPDVMVRNNGGTSFSVNWSEPAGDVNPTRGITACDFDQDGDMDIFASAYRLENNHLWINNGTGSFTDQAALFGADGNAFDNPDWAFAHTIGSAWGDLDNDGTFDLFVGNFAHPAGHFGCCARQPESQFLRNKGPSGSYHFEDMSDVAGLAWKESFASPALGDYDNDGNLDLFLGNAPGYGDTSVLYRNLGSWQFTEVTSAEGLSSVADTYQGAWADFDNDGDLDLLAGGTIYQNQATGNHWLKVALEGNGTTVNRSAIGAQVRVTAGATIRSRQVEAGTGQGNQNEMTLHFGLGSRTAPVDVEILWPDCTTLNIDNVAVDQLITQNTPSGPGPPPSAPIGNPSPANGWDTTSAVSIRAGREKPGRPWISVINGDGIDPTGQLHTDCLEADCVTDGSMPATMGFADNGVTPARGGTVAGSQWVEFAFDDTYRVADMLIWNYNEDNANAPDPDTTTTWTMQGMKEVTIQYTTVGNGAGWGSNHAGDWTTLGGGPMVLARASGSNLLTAQAIPLNDNARYVVITSAGAPEANFMNDFGVSSTSTEAALSEVRFLVGALEITRTEIRGETFFQFQSQTGTTYRLERATTMSPANWADTGCVLAGDGTLMYAFDPAGYSATNSYRITEE